MILAAAFGFVACGGANQAENKTEEAQAPEVEVVEEAVVEEAVVEAPAEAVAVAKPVEKPAVEAEKKVDMGQVAVRENAVEFKTAEQANKEFKAKVEQEANTIVLNAGKKVDAAVMEATNGAQLSAEKSEPKTLKQAGSLKVVK